jgi:hypothetical protein
VHYVTRRTKTSGARSLLHLPAVAGVCKRKECGYRTGTWHSAENRGGQAVSKQEKLLLTMHGNYVEQGRRNEVTEETK